MDDLRNDPEYEIRWPVDILASELDRLIAQVGRDGPDMSWHDEVATVLGQAFASVVPLQDFEESWDRSSGGALYEEPF